MHLPNDGLIDVKNELILWKLSSIQMNNIEWTFVCKLNWIQIYFIEFDFN
jgi:hypothetical protein